METEKKVLKYLIENKNEITIRDLSKKIKSDYKIVHTAISRLIGKKVVSDKKMGKASIITFNSKLSKDVLEVEFERREEILKNKNLRIMLNSFKENIKTSNLIILLFGSYAKKTSTSSSDIDLIFILPDLNLEKNIDNTISLLPLKLHPLIFSEEQFIKMKNSNEINVVKEAIKNNIILFGIEQYYDILSK